MQHSLFKNSKKFLHSSYNHAHFSIQYLTLVSKDSAKENADINEIV